MLKLIGTFTNLFLILIIFLRIPQDNVGLSSFATKSNFLGSPRFVQRFLNIVTSIGIVIYFTIAIQINLLDN